MLSGTSTHLAPAVTDVLRLPIDPREVLAALHRICTPDGDVFSTFKQAADIVVAFTIRNAEASGAARAEGDGS